MRGRPDRMSDHDHLPVPMLRLASFYFAFRERFVTHARVARILFPIWLYVSITGVVIFFMLRP